MIDYSDNLVKSAQVMCVNVWMTKPVKLQFAIMCTHSTSDKLQTIFFHFPYK
jgi:hypothetical protein